MVFPHFQIRLVSTSILLFIGLVLTATTIGTNLFLALSLPTSTSPDWVVEETSLSTPMFSEEPEDRDMMHVVTSRFMQLQPRLISLGEARLRLFETFCLPSMLNQLAKNFVWFIMTDPDLDSRLLNRLKALVSPYPHFYVVLLNSNLVTPANLTALVENHQIVTGDLNVLLSLMLDTNRPLLLETRLDADDALSQGTLLRIQDQARSLPEDTNGWQVICNNLHFEWRNDAITDLNQTVESAGQLRIVMESICITAGYTLVRHREKGSIDFPRWPRIGHHLITRDWPKCQGDENATTDCWTRLPRYPAALRSRTFTSAGMSRILINQKESDYDNQTAELWPHVQEDFGISPDEARATSQLLKANLQAIVKENLDGQCTFGHSCKFSSKKKLQELLVIASNRTQ